MAGITMQLTNLIAQAVAKGISGKNTNISFDLKTKFEDLLKKLAGGEKSFDLEEVGLDCFERTTNAESKKPNSIQANKLMSYFDNDGDRVLNNEEIDGLKNKMFVSRNAIETNKEYNEKTGEYEYKPLDINNAKKEVWYRNGAEKWELEHPGEKYPGDVSTQACGSVEVDMTEEEKELLRKYDADGDGILSPEEQVSMERDMDEVDKILEDNISVHETPESHKQYKNIEIGDTVDKKIGSMEYLQETGIIPFRSKNVASVKYDDQGRIISYGIPSGYYDNGEIRYLTQELKYNDDGTIEQSYYSPYDDGTKFVITYDKNGKEISSVKYDKDGNIIPPSPITIGPDDPILNPDIEPETGLPEIEKPRYIGNPWKIDPEKIKYGIDKDGTY